MIQETARKIQENMGRIILGKDEEILMLTVSLLCGGHVLLEDVPGTGKTTLALCAARTVGCKFGRIQFTPDLLPSDITGVNFYSQRNESFTFRKGPVFSGILLADEINRAAPRTQSALLECMEERQVTADGKSFELPFPFMVIATQNPLEMHGTYPLLEAQLDRFFMSMSTGYPSRESELAMLMGNGGRRNMTDIGAVVSEDDVRACMAEASGIHVSECIAQYILDIAQKTRNSREYYLGISPRGCIDILSGAKVLAGVEGRSYVIPDDVQRLAPYVFSHRITAFSSEISSLLSKRELIAETVSEIPVPKEELWKF